MACGQVRARSFFPSGFPTKTLCIALLLHLRATCAAHFLSFITQIISDEWHKSEVSHFAVFLQSPVVSTPFAPDISLSTPFSNTLSLCPSLNVRGQLPKSHNFYNNVSHYINRYVLKWEIRTQKFLAEL